MNQSLWRDFGIFVSNVSFRFPPPRFAGDETGLEIKSQGHQVIKLVVWT